MKKRPMAVTMIMMVERAMMKVQRNLDAKEMSGTTQQNEDEIPEGKKNPVNHIDLGSLHHYLQGLMH